MALLRRNIFRLIGTESAVKVLAGDQADVSIQPPPKGNAGEGVGDNLNPEPST
jgi:hypothetical protein